jgi:hypothetical protein
MRLKSRITTPLALAALALVALVPVAGATPLPALTTHTDAASQVDNASSGDAPRITLFKSSTTSKLIQRGYLAVDARCNLRCVIAVVATGKVSGKSRVLGSAEKTLPAGKTRTIKIRVRSDVKKLVQGGLKFKFDATPSAVL